MNSLALKEYTVNNTGLPQELTEEDWDTYRNEFNRGTLSKHDIVAITDWSISTVIERLS